VRNTFQSNDRPLCTEHELRNTISFNTCHIIVGGTTFFYGIPGGPADVLHSELAEQEMRAARAKESAENEMRTEGAEELAAKRPY